MKKNVKKVVTLVTIPSNLSVILYPHLGDYDHPYITKMVPCEERKGKYYDLRTGAEVVCTSNTLVWNNLTGTVFVYPDGEYLLVTRQLKDRQLICMEISPAKVHPETMFLRRIVEREVKKNSYL